MRKENINFSSIIDLVNTGKQNLVGLYDSAIKKVAIVNNKEILIVFRCDDPRRFGRRQERKDSHAVYQWYNSSGGRSSVSLLT